MSRQYKKLCDIFWSAPSRPKILASLPQLTRAFLRFPATAGQSSSVSVITLPRYLNSVTVRILFP